MKKSTKLIYLDHAATTPVDPRVVKAMQSYWSDKFANPSALYKSGMEAKDAINSARANIAQVLNAKPSEIIFTAGGTESNNIAIQGAAINFAKTHQKAGHIITTAIEHHSVLHIVDALKNYGWKIDYAPTDKEGFVDLAALKKLVRKDTALISIMYANNEVGTIEPIAEIGKWLTGLNKIRVQKDLPRILFHTDACQAGGTLSLDTHELKVDLLTLNGSKIYGPKQTGILFVRSGVKLEIIIHGGGQERDLRSGTENVPGIVGLSAALAFAQKNLAKENKRQQELQVYFSDRLSKKVKHIQVNGPAISKRLSAKSIHPAQNKLNRLPNNINISFKDVEGESLMLYLDSYNIAVATGSACATTSTDPSHVLVALNGSQRASQKDAYSAVRFTIGKSTTKQQLDYVVDVLGELVPMLRKVKQLN
jgi:cysteine desulfurase